MKLDSHADLENIISKNRPMLEDIARTSDAIRNDMDKFMPEDLFASLLFLVSEINKDTNIEAISAAFLHGASYERLRKAEELRQK